MTVVVPHPGRSLWAVLLASVLHVCCTGLRVPPLSMVPAGPLNRVKQGPAGATRSRGTGDPVRPRRLRRLAYTDSPSSGLTHRDAYRRRAATVAWVAQSVEQRTRNAQVRSSNLLSGSSSEGMCPGYRYPERRSNVAPPSVVPLSVLRFATWVSVPEERKDAGPPGERVGRSWRPSSWPVAARWPRAPAHGRVARRPHPASDVCSSPRRSGRRRSTCRRVGLLPRAPSG